MRVYLSTGEALSVKTEGLSQCLLQHVLVGQTPPVLPVKHVGQAPVPQAVAGQCVPLRQSSGYAIWQFASWTVVVWWKWARVRGTLKACGMAA